MYSTPKEFLGNSQFGVLVRIEHNALAFEPASTRKEFLGSLRFRVLV